MKKIIHITKEQKLNMIVLRNGEPFSRHRNFYNAQCAIERHLRNDLKNERASANPYETFDYKYGIFHISELKDK